MSNPDLEYFRNLGKVFREVNKFFKNSNKSDQWISAPNPAFGNLTPVYLIKRGKTEKVLKWIKATLEENSRDATDKEVEEASKIINEEHSDLFKKLAEDD